MISKSKSIKLIKASLAIFIFLIIFWTIIHPRTYPYQLSLKNYDVINGPEGSKNTNKMDQFIEDLKQDKISTLRVVHYSKEGYPTIYNLKNESGQLTCRIDDTRNTYGRELFPVTLNVASIFKKSLVESTEYYIRSIEGEEILIHWTEY